MVTGRSDVPVHHLQFQRELAMHSSEDVHYPVLKTNNLDSSGDRVQVLQR